MSDQLVTINGVEVINGVAYSKKPKSAYKELVFEPICDHCKGCDVCNEPHKDRRLSCPDELYDKYLNLMEEQNERS